MLTRQKPVAIHLSLPSFSFRSKRLVLTQSGEVSLRILQVQLVYLCAHQVHLLGLNGKG